MIVIYLFIVLLSVLVFLLTWKSDRKLRIAVSLLVFVVLSAIVTVYVWHVGDQPLPDSKVVRTMK